MLCVAIFSGIPAALSELPDRECNTTVRPSLRNSGNKRRNSGTCLQTRNTIPEFLKIDKKFEKLLFLLKNSVIVKWEIFELYFRPITEDDTNERRLPGKEGVMVRERLPH